MADYERQFAGVKKTGGLAGIVAADSAVSTVGIEGRGLSYRGYAIEDLAAHAGFEEVAWLLLRGELPQPEQLADYRRSLKDLRKMPPALARMLGEIPPGDSVMGILRTAVSLLGNLEPERRAGDALPAAELPATDLPAAGPPAADLPAADLLQLADRLVAVMPSILLSRLGKDLPDDEDTIAGYFLHGLMGRRPPDDLRQCLDVSLVLYAEHEFNASTFAARVITSTLSDVHSAVAGAIGALAGPLHGGANEEAMRLIEAYAGPDEAERGLLKRLERKDKIMGFGHRIYTVRDPRSPIIKEWARRLARRPEETRLLAVAERIEQVMWEQKKLFPNLDFYSALAYRFCGIPTELYTPMFVLSRMSGWMAHIMEQRSNNKLIRPISRYTGPEPRVYVSLVPEEK